MIELLPVLAVIFFMGLVPMIVYTTILWWIDHWEREPWYLIAAAFIWGAIPSCILACITNTTVGTVLSVTVLGDPNQANAALAVLVAPPVEESIKALALLFLFLAFRHHIDTLLDGLIYGAAVGFGFAAIENIVYFGGVISAGGGAVDLGLLIFIRAFLFGLNHAYFTGMTGLAFALARYRKNIFLKLLLPLLGLLFAMSLHALHNLLATMAGFAFVESEGAGLAVLGLAAFVHFFGVFWVFVLIVVSLVMQGRWLRHYLKEEVSRGVLTQEQADGACSIWQRVRFSVGSGLVTFQFGRQVRASRRVNRRLKQLAARLAIKKHQLARLGDEKGVAEEIDYLRNEVAKASREMITAGTA